MPNPAEQSLPLPENYNLRSYDTLFSAVDKQTQSAPRLNWALRRARLDRRMATYLGDEGLDVNSGEKMGEDRVEDEGQQ